MVEGAVGSQGGYFALFEGYWRNQPLRDVTRADAARFMDAVRLLDPVWARSPCARTLPWAGLQRRYGDRERGLSDATMTRQAATLQALWEWAAERYTYERVGTPFVASKGD